jgi:hypothetical protein
MDISVGHIYNTVPQGYKPIYVGRKNIKNMEGGDGRFGNMDFDIKLFGKNIKKYKSKIDELHKIISVSKEPVILLCHCIRTPVLITLSDDVDEYTCHGQRLAYEVLQLDLKKNEYVDELKHIVHIPKGRKNDDAYFLKVKRFYKDGSDEIKIFLKRNVKRPFYITKFDKRNHDDKREYEKLENLIEYKSTQSDLLVSAGRALKMNVSSPWKAKRVTSSPYVYGLDISGVTFIKNHYKKKYDKTSYNTVMTLDLENDVDTNELLILSVAYKDFIYTAILWSFAKKIGHSKASLKRKIVEKYKELMTDHPIANKIGENIEVVFFDKEVDMVIDTFKVVHKHKPDYLSIHNVNHELPFFLTLLERNNVNPEDVFCDPMIPKDYRFFNYKQGKDKKSKDGGGDMSIAPQQQWHVVTATASFQIVDSMSVYYYIRMAESNVPGGYSLENLLKVNKFDGKLKHDLGKTFVQGSPDWHKEMVANHGLEYIIYNQGDVVLPLMLDDLTVDLKSTLPGFIGIASYEYFNSSPKILLDNIYFFLKDLGYILGSLDRNYKDVDNLLGKSGWIVTLVSTRIEQMLGAAKLKHGGISNTRTFIFDSDAVSSYPSDTIAANISSTTTEKELKSIDGIAIEIVKYVNLQLLTGYTGIEDVLANLYGFPTIEQIIKKSFVDFNKKK